MHSANQRAAVSGCRRCWAARGMSVGVAVGWSGVGPRTLSADSLCFVCLPRASAPRARRYEREGRPVGPRGSLCAPGQGAKGV